MNKERRKKIKEISDKLMDLQADLQWVAEEEEEARDSMPESLEGSDRYTESEEASQAMENADGAIQEAIDYLSDII